MLSGYLHYVGKVLQMNQNLERDKFCYFLHSEDVDGICERSSLTS